MREERMPVRRLGSVTVFAMAVLTAHAAAQVQPPSYFNYVVAGVVSSDGLQGSRWRTDLDATNHDIDATLTLCYTSNASARDCIQAPILSGQTLHYADVAGTVFQRPGTFGYVTATTSQSASKLEIRARTYNIVVDPSSPLVGGTLGASLPVTATSDLLTTAYSYRVSGAPDTAAFRQNLTFFTTDQASTITAVLKDNKDNPLGTETITLPPWSVTQNTVAGLFGTTWPNNFIDIDVTNSDAGVYFSAIDNTSNSPVISVPFKRSPTVADQWIVSSANINGANGTTWKTDVTLNSTISDNTQLSVTLLYANSDNSSVPWLFTTVTNQAQQTITDIVGTFMNQPGRYGALRLQSNHPLLASSRTYNTITVNGQSLGTVGMTLSALTTGATNKNADPRDTTNETDLSLNGLREDSGFRTNLMLLNANDRIAQQPITLTAFDDSGNQAGTSSLTLRTLEMTQVNQVLKQYGLTSGRITISVPPNTGVSDHPNVLVMATVIDNVTGQASAKTGYPVVVVPKVTGEQYVAAWLDLLKTQYFYLSNTEVRCMISGNCGVRSYAPDLASVMGPASGNSAALYESLLRQWTDGATENGELFHAFDPMNVNMRPPYGIRFYYEPTGAAGDTVVDSNAMTGAYQVIRAFLVAYVAAYPDEYGGSAATGPDLFHNPTWSTQDPN